MRSKRDSVSDEGLDSVGGTDCGIFVAHYSKRDQSIGILVTESHNIIPEWHGIVAGGKKLTKCMWILFPPLAYRVASLLVRWLAGVNYIQYPQGNNECSEPLQLQRAL